MIIQSYYFKEPEKKCDDLEAWCPEIDTAKDCCAPYIQTKCPGSCDTCPGNGYSLSN